MVKLEWGTKRSCWDCGADFYDLRRDPIVCPKCGAELDAQVQVRPPRRRPAARPTVVATDQPGAVANDLRAVPEKLGSDVEANEPAEDINVAGQDSGDDNGDQAI